MENVFEVEEFTRRTLEAAGARLMEVQKGKWLAEIPAGSLRELGLETDPGGSRRGESEPGEPSWEGKSKLVLAFDASLAGELSVEYVAPGSLFLDKLIGYARKRGNAASFLWPGPADPPARPKDWLQRLFANCTPAPVGARLFYQHHVFFCFRVAYISDEKREEIREFLVDPWSEKVVADFNAGIMPEFVAFSPSPGLSGSVRQKANTAKPEGKRNTRHDSTGSSKKLTLGEHLAKAGKLRQRAYQLIRLYQVACEALEEEIAPSTARFAAEVRQRLDKEAQQVEEYYAALKQEVTGPLRQLFHRVAGAAVRLDLARSVATGSKYERQLAALQKELREAEKACEKELGLLNAECERRLGELREKYAARVEIELVNAADIYLPRVVYEVQLVQHGRAAAVTPVSLDLRTGGVYDFYCQGCGKTLEQAYLDDTGAVACRDCVELCERCGEAAAAYGKGLTRCHVCGRRICARCAVRCDNPMVHASQRVGASSWTHASGGELAACVDCRGSTCAICTGVWPALGVEWRWGAAGSDTRRQDASGELAGKAVAAANIFSQCFL
ncbi:MAG: hypothetical protein ACM3TT_06925 [Syntrophothermus sp.]